MTRMTKKNIRLIKQSIAHWQRMHDNKLRNGEEPYADDCALCREYVDNHKCGGCPIAAKTGHYGCDGTPYDEAKLAFEVWGYDSSEFAYEAMRMIDFLTDLLPEDERT